MLEPQAKYLGIVLDNKLGWKMNIENWVKKNFLYLPYKYFHISDPTKHHGFFISSEFNWSSSILKAPTTSALLLEDSWRGPEISLICQPQYEHLKKKPSSIMKRKE